ncbi:MAG TPA: EamA family transporter, partial [Gemmatimonadales bacterium]|nr:EamA family transporter [Gemmatimonadales bacterium]
VTAAASSRLVIPPRLAIATAALIFSTGGAAIKYAAFSPWQVASFRSGLAALTLLILAPRLGLRITSRSALVGLAYAATLVGFVLANRLTTGANAIYLQSTAPFFVLLLGPFILGERMRRSDFPVIVAVLVGLVLVLSAGNAPSSSAPNPRLGNILALGTGLTYALMICGLRWLNHDGGIPGESVGAVALGNIFAFAAALPMALPVGIHPASDWLLLGYLGVIQIALAYLLVDYGLKRVPALDASLLLLVETALNPVWTWLLMGEIPATAAIAGGAAIIAATVLQSINAARNRPALESA